MLDFLLVLGQIPGTNIQLSFGQIVALVLASLLGVRLWRRPALRRKYAYRFHLTVFYIQHFHILRRAHN